jgi:hypothetical protein
MWNDSSTNDESLLCETPSRQSRSALLANLSRGALGARKWLGLFTTRSFTLSFLLLPRKLGKKKPPVFRAPSAPTPRSPAQRRVF